MLNRIKKIMAWFGNHLFAAVLGVVITSSIAVSIITFFWKWLKTIYSLEMTGLAWVLIAIAISAISALIVFWVMRQKPYEIEEVLTDEVDITNRLKQWFRHFMNCNLSLCGCQETLFFSDLDRELELASGSTNRYIEQIVKRFPGWGTKNKGKDSIIIFHPPIMRV